MMRVIGNGMDKATGAFKVSGIEKPALLDMCMAPGGFVAHALKKTPHLKVRAMTLAKEDKGHAVRLVDETVQVEFYDVTTLAADMGVVEEDIPVAFPGPHGLLFEKVFINEERFDIVICGGAVVHTQQRQEWREKREASRLTLAQLALSLEHLKPGGTMVILLHKPETWRCFHLIQQLSNISKVQMFKHPKHHGIRSAFYVVAKQIRADSQLAQAMVAEWKQQYKIATLGTDEEYYAMHQVSNELVGAAMEEFGEEYVKMGKKIWKTQADALERAPFIKNATGGQHRTSS
ncbi:methyltransferase family [Fusarium beomiforme]|uniref:Methyltransferase family n=1 Tax=Fusarium beomiforme TaxID=44412 RepID=A0A9P5ALD1_9HYPO|nr:methyltransferase family [Fusarium beomiforme]